MQSRAPQAACNEPMKFNSYLLQKQSTAK